MCECFTIAYIIKLKINMNFKLISRAEIRESLKTIILKFSNLIEIQKIDFDYFT